MIPAKVLELVAKGVLGISIVMKVEAEMISKEFVLAGKAIFTLEIPHDWASEHDCAAHYTYKVVLKEGKDKPNGGKWDDTYFVNLLSGPDNGTDYQYVGVLNKERGNVVLTRASKITNDCLSFRLLNRVLANLWSNTEEKILEAGFDVHHEGKCGRCGRRLTVPESIKSGLGPECAGRTPGRKKDEPEDEDVDGEVF